MKKFYCMTCMKYRCRAGAIAVIKVTVEFGYGDSIEAEAENKWVESDEVAAGSFTCLICGGPVVIREGEMVFMEIPSE